MRRGDLMRRLRGSALVLVAEVVIVITVGVTAALVTEAVTGSARYGLWAGSAVTVGATSIILRNRR